VDLLSHALLQPGEQRVGQTVVKYMPWWAFGFINKTYLVLATTQRIILVEHRMAWFHQAVRLHSVESIPRASLQEARVTGLFNKKLRVRGQSQTGPVALKAVIPNAFFGLLAPMRGNMAGARAVEAAFAAPAFAPQPPIQALPPAPQPAYALPPPAPQYAQPPYGPTQPSMGAIPFAQPPVPPPADARAYAQYQQQAGAPSPSIPPQNAPGYQSSPPPPVEPLRSSHPGATFYSPAGHAPPPPNNLPRASAPPLPPPRTPYSRN